tara:strand:+ start:20101 stop:20403 length:303 start_codon:yes stop_codon:yes gene_type:complete
MFNALKCYIDDDLETRQALLKQEDVAQDLYAWLEESWRHTKHGLVEAPKGATVLYCRGTSPDTIESIRRARAIPSSEEEASFTHVAHCLSLKISTTFLDI